jgi:hypothetical protein
LQRRPSHHPTLETKHLRGSWLKPKPNIRLNWRKQHGPAFNPRRQAQPSQRSSSSTRKTLSWRREDAAPIEEDPYDAYDQYNDIIDLRESPSKEMSFSHQRRVKQFAPSFTANIAPRRAINHETHEIVCAKLCFTRNHLAPPFPGVMLAHRQRNPLLTKRTAHRNT